MLFAELRSVKTPAFSYLLRIPHVAPESPIVAIQLDEPKELAKFLQSRGMMVRAVVPPTVPEGTSRVRVCLHAGNTKADIKLLVAVMEEWCVEKARRERVPQLDEIIPARL